MTTLRGEAGRSELLAPHRLGPQTVMAHDLIHDPTLPIVHGSDVPVELLHRSRARTDERIQWCHVDRLRRSVVEGRLLADRPLTHMDHVHEMDLSALPARLRQIQHGVSPFGFFNPLFESCGIARRGVKGRRVAVETTLREERS